MNEPKKPVIPTTVQGDPKMSDTSDNFAKGLQQGLGINTNELYKNALKNYGALKKQFPDSYIEKPQNFKDFKDDKENGFVDLFDPNKTPEEEYKEKMGYYNNDLSSRADSLAEKKQFNELAMNGVKKILDSYGYEENSPKRKSFLKDFTKQLGGSFEPLEDIIKGERPVSSYFKRGSIAESIIDDLKRDYDDYFNDGIVKDGKHNKYFDPNDEEGSIKQYLENYEPHSRYVWDDNASDFDNMMAQDSIDTYEGLYSPDELDAKQWYQGLLNRYNKNVFRN